MRLVGACNIAEQRTPRMSFDTCSGGKGRDTAVTFAFNVTAGQIDNGGIGISYIVDDLLGCVPSVISVPFTQIDERASLGVPANDRSITNTTKLNGGACQTSQTRGPCLLNLGPGFRNLSSN